MSYFTRWQFAKHTPGGHEHDQQNHAGHAPAGGIFGINGAWYKGGQFLPGSKHTVQGAFKLPKGQLRGKKAEIEPFKWQPRPFDGAQPFIRNLQDLMDWRHWHRTGEGRIADLPVWLNFRAKQLGVTPDELKAQAEGAIAAWNAGARWLDQAGNPYRADGTPLT